MKMRIQGSVIRFRLNRREVAEFEATGRAAAAIDFPGGKRLTYALVQGGSAVDAGFDGAEIQVRLPQPMVAEWTSTERVGIEARAPLDGGQQLEIIVEKDFQCMHKGEAAKDPEAYPNPMAN